MFNSRMPYIARVRRQQQQRRKKRKASLDILHNSDSYVTSSDDDLFMNYKAEHPINTHEDTTYENIARDNNIRKVTVSKPDGLLQPNDLNANTVTYISNCDDDDGDNNIDWNENLVDLSPDSSLRLYENSHMSVKAAATSIMSMAIEFNFAKNVIEKILKVIKSFLPTPNMLPTTLTSILKLFHETSTTSSEFYCNLCLKLCTLRSGRKLCINEKCKLFNKVLRNRNISEVVTFDIKQQLKSITARNISLFGNNKFAEPFDISCGSYYKEMMILLNTSNQMSKTQTCSISLNIHTDGAPLVRTTKSSLWPCMASIVELPPQVRENQKNIIILCLWNSSIKSSVNLFMKDSIQQLLDLATPFTLSINDLQFSISVRTQLFLADLPAKALFWKTINYNGYNACTNCFTEGEYKSRQVLYPYNKNNYRQRTHVEFLATAEEVDNRTSNEHKNSSIYGVKGLLCILSYLPSTIVSHFALYSMFIKLLHSPRSIDEIKLADKIIHYYCHTAPQIYSETIELFSLHAHLHLPQQVLTDDGLCFTSAFCFESTIRYLKKKAHGTRQLATQSSDWINIGTAIKQNSFQLSTPIAINNSSFDQYRHEFLNILHDYNGNKNDIILFLRYKDIFVTYHSRLYDLRFNCSSCIVSYKTAESSIEYGQTIVFFQHNTDYYGFVQKYTDTKKRINAQMTQNAYAKLYTTEARGKKDAEFAFISYMDEPNSFSVVSIKRLINADSFGTLIEMEKLAQEAEELSTYKMNSDVVSDTEEWLKRKKSSTKKNNDKTSLLDKQLTELHTFDFDAYRTYTTLDTCLFDEPDKAADCSRILSDKDDHDDDNNYESSCDEERDTIKTTDDHVFNSTFNHILTSKPRKRTSRVSREISVKRLRVNDTSSPTANQEKLGVNQSLFSPIKEINYNLDQLRKQIAGLGHSHEQHQKTLNLILNNQKKIAKAMRSHKIPIVLFDEIGRELPSSTTDSYTTTCNSTTGEQIELLQIPADKTNPNKFVLKAIDRVFKEGKELLDIDPRSIDTDDRIRATRDAVKIKFGLKNDELATVWIPMLECIKSKRRNFKAKLRNTIISSSVFLEKFYSLSTFFLLDENSRRIDLESLPL
ncbi:unnamed protein product [Rotaria magnacalcarata]|uniref:Uncharacterized protein n=4 Tax=Rotaria magnacalcarata TaxID=392030 RepID=A0A816MX46_9BILA|nr:unnamed protein product [Rotaria magnacalcarata]